MPVQTVIYPFNPSASPYTPAYGGEEDNRFTDVGKSLRELPSNASQGNNQSQGEESSPGSSPEITPSLMNIPSLSDTPGPSPDTPASSRSLSDRTFAPPKKARNLKNLAVNTTSTMSYGRAFSTAALPVQTREVSSPLLPGPVTASFIKPPLALPRRTSSKLGLTLMTPTLDTRPAALENSIVPPTPSLARPATLRRFQSSPLLPLNVPGTAGHPSTPIDPIRTGFSVIPSELDEIEQQQFDVPQSCEDKPEAYPDGPICIYEPHVYLYYEPTAEEASGYDVILNVASEVLNPFPTDVDHVAGAKDNQSRKPIVDFPATTTKPEYIHIPWEHNTDIVPDLYRLVQLIDDRVQRGKRVLIHCQCGVSRSASLIVAYGLYKNPSITVQQAYDTVKRRSKWIGPNMSLIMQLQEFRTKLLNVSSPAISTQRARSKTSLARFSGPSSSGVVDKVPQSAPLHQKAVPPAISVVSGAVVTPGPSSAPSTMTSSAGTMTAGEDPFPAVHPPVVTASNPLVQTIAVPWRDNPRKMAVTLPEDILSSPRNTEFAMASIRPPSIDDTFGLTSPRIGTFPSALSSVAEKVEACPPHNHPTRRPPPPVSQLALPRGTSDSLDAIMSPRVAEFTINPLHNEDAAAPAAQRKKGAEDPRSPPPAQKGSMPIVRSIFNVL